ncbi:MAG: UbiA family prenyltransferase [Bacteroidia bacterium]|nr:UbiA family prenyltransferase [Bacteroidia bacterium]
MVFNFILNRVYYPFVKYRIHISLIFLFLLINVYTNTVKQPVLWPIVISFFIWHFALYIFDRAYDYKLDAINQPQEAILPGERRFFIVLSFILCLLPLFILPYAGYSVLAYLPFIPVTFLYTYPVYKNLRSKNILLFKNIYSALFIWTLPLAFVAYFYSTTTQAFFEIFKTNFLGLFIYVMVGEAFWDIRDVDGDRTQNVRTIPVVFGVLATKIYLLALILIDLLVFGKTVSDSTVVYCILIIFVKPQSPRWLFHIPPLLALYRFIAPHIF